MYEIHYYLTEDGESPFADWFASLNPVARAKVTTAIARMEQATSRMRSRSVKVFSNVGSTSGPVTGCISDAMVPC